MNTYSTFTLALAISACGSPGDAVDVSATAHDDRVGEASASPAPRAKAGADAGLGDAGPSPVLAAANASNGVAVPDAAEQPAVRCTRCDGPPRGGADWALFKHDVDARSCVKLRFEVGACFGLSVAEQDVCLVSATLWENVEQCPPTQDLPQLQAVDANGSLGPKERDVSVDLRFEVEAGVRNIHVDFAKCESFTQLPIPC